MPRSLLCPLSIPKFNENNTAIFHLLSGKTFWSILVTNRPSSLKRSSKDSIVFVQTVLKGLQVKVLHLWGATVPDRSLGLYFRGHLLAYSQLRKQDVQQDHFMHLGKTLAEHAASEQVRLSLCSNFFLKCLNDSWNPLICLKIFAIQSHSSNFN